MEPQAGGSLGVGPDAPAVLQFARLGIEMRRRFGRAMSQEAWAQEAGLRPGCFGVLRAVAGAPTPPSQRTLSDELGMDPSDLVGIIDILEAAGYLERQRDPEDRRRYALTLTRAGEQAHDRFLEVSAGVADEAFAVLAPADRESFERILGELVDGLVAEIEGDHAALIGNALAHAGERPVPSAPC